MYNFSFAAFLFGLIILAAGVIFVRYHQWVANNFGSGVSDYDLYKLWAFATCAFGFLVMLNMHSLILSWLVSFFI